MLDQLKDVFRCLHRRRVKYVTIGGIAAVLHGVPRATFDLDILIEATEANAKRLINALLDAGLMSAELTDETRLASHEITVFNELRQAADKLTQCGDDQNGVAYLAADLIAILDADDDDEKALGLKNVARDALKGFVEVLKAEDSALMAFLEEYHHFHDEACTVAEDDEKG